MAVTRQKIFTIDLGDAVEARINAFNLARNGIRARKEASFQNRIAEEGMSYVLQLDHRRAELEEAKGEDFVDLSFVEELKTEISSLRKLSKFEKMREEYLENYTRYKEGKTNINNLITFIENQLVGETDPNIRAELNDSLSKARLEKARVEQEVLTNRVALAEKDNSIAVIDKAIIDVDKRRNEAIRVGDTETASLMDISKQNLENRKNQLEVQNKIHDFELSVIRKGSSSTEKLDLLNSMVSNSDSTKPFEIGDITWGSESEYWQTIRQQYLSGTGTGELTSFFEEFNTEQSNNVTKLAISNKFGYVPISSIQAVDNNYKALLGRSEFAGLETLVENNRLSEIIKAVDKTANAIMTEAEFFGDYTRGYQSLRNVQSQFGIDMNSYIGQLYSTQISTTPTRAAQLAKTAEILAEQRGTTVEEEFAKLTIPPVEVADVILGDEGVTPPEGEAPPTPPAEVPEAQSIVIQRGDNLTRIAKRHNTTIDEILKINPEITDPNLIIAGKSLKIPGAKIEAPVEPKKIIEPEPVGANVPIPPTPASTAPIIPPAPTPTPTPTPEPTTTPTPTPPSATGGIVIPTGAAAVGKQVTIGGNLYPSQEWYDVKVLGKPEAT